VFPPFAATRKHLLVSTPTHKEITMRIDFRIQDNEPASEALRALPQRERANALRLMLRRHFGELAGLIGFREPQRSAPGETASLATETATGTPAHAIAAETSTKGALRAALDALRARGTAAVALLAALAIPAFAPIHTAAAATWRLDANLASIHTERWARNSLNQRNPGIGIEYQASRTWTLAGGIYTNSYRKPTVYALAEFTPLHLGAVNHWHLDAGIAAGIATGYNRAEIPCAPLAGAAVIRIVTPDGVALNVMGAPNRGAYNSGFIGFQLSIPLSRGH
jgi:hypothetical protein